jgi:hypothetical protein
MGSRWGGAGQLAVRPRGTGGGTGMRTRSTVLPGWESMVIVPAWRSTTMRCAMWPGDFGLDEGWPSRCLRLQEVIVTPFGAWATRCRGV